ncbi:hypothetical protein G7Z17_g1438 [Cylindrodendrum hubeiense]|uniref:Uncharacterized protein n=1 Tax=Cylindrodendrum hubeiense TaxID=595255 RepID=A0A9P5HLI9_9HYPO|nr:hypothetical protein G7Z17_g1438 [Cylindrodendrum hubeiense]
MTNPTPIILCGKTEQIGRGVIEGLKPEYEVVHFVLTPEAGVKEIPQVLQGKLPDVKSSDIGSGNLTHGVKAVVLGGAYEDEGITVMRDAVSSIAEIAWVRQDTTQPTPPLGPEYGKAMVARVKEALGKLEASGQLGENSPEFCAKTFAAHGYLDAIWLSGEASGERNRNVQENAQYAPTVSAWDNSASTARLSLIPANSDTTEKFLIKEYRMEALEGKLDRLIENLSPPTNTSRPTTTSCRQAPTPQSQIISDEPWSGQAQPRAQPSADAIASEQTLLETGQLYLTWCHNQPIALFREENFLDSLKGRDREVLLAIKALSLRFPPGSLTPQKRERLHVMAKASRRLLDFAESPTAGTLAQSQRGSPALTGRVPGQQPQDSGQSNDLAQRTQPGSIILSYAASLTDAWRMARAYAASRVSADGPAPWTPDSDYSAVMLRHLEIDCKVPLKYRFAANDFGGHGIETLQSQRSYWGPWLFLQFIYAAIPCLLNHPFLLSMRLRSFRYTMPQSFIQQSFDQITRHAGWIIYFLDQLEKKDYQVSDPVLGHCVAIVATIHLQHSFVKEYALRDKAQAGFETCMRFLQRMGSVWPSVSLMAQNLRKLQESIVFVPSPRPDGEENEDNQESWSIDAQLLWDILIYEKAGREGAARDCSIFDDSLTAGPENQRQDVAEFDLVGSAGIFGHKTAPKEVPVYAPDEDTSPLERTNVGAVRAVPETAHEDRAYERFAGLNEQDGLFLQPNDFGRAIDNWFNFDLV